MGRRLAVGIAGAGVGGLAAAALLADLGHEVAILDRFEAPRPVGSGLILQPVGLAVLDRLGAGGAARALGAPIRGMLGTEAASGRPVLRVAYGREPGVGMHRAALFHVLHEAALARGLGVRAGAEVAGRDGPRLVLADGTRTAPFDLIVDAAGARSPLSPLHSRPLPYGALWTTVPWCEAAGLPPDRLTQRYRRADRMVGVLPIGRLPGAPAPLAALFWSLPRDGHADWLSRGIGAWREEARALWPEAGPFLDGIAEGGALAMARYDHGTLRRPWGEGIVHIGDAAHRASPQLGQGANMALLDVLSLALALEARPGRDALPEALALHAAARRAHVRAYQAMSALFTPQYQSDSRWLPVLRDRALYPLSRVPPVPRVLAALVAGRLLPPLGRLSAGMGR